MQFLVGKIAHLTCQFIDMFCLMEIGDGSFEYPQQMFWLRNKNNNFQLPTLNWRPVIHIGKLSMDASIVTCNLACS